MSRRTKVKTKVLYLAIVLAMVFSLNACSSGIGEDLSRLSSIDTIHMTDGGNNSIAGRTGHILLLGAFGQEIDGVRRYMDVEEVVDEQGYELYRGKYANRDILLVRTGMGKERAESATNSVLEHYPVNAIVSLGVAGGLNPDLEIGDVVLCSTLYGENGSGQEDPRAEPCTSDSYLISLASQGLENIEVNCRIGTSVSVLELDSDLQRQQELAETFGADIVEMESYWIARIASDRGIPFIAIRSISDRGSDVQPFDQILSPEGDLLWDEAIVSFSLHPNHLLKVLNLYLQVRVAHRSLTTCVLNLVART
jgi:adenosylhomocysteine nucleosidase